MYNKDPPKRGALTGPLVSTSDFQTQRSLGGSGSGLSALLLTRVRHWSLVQHLFLDYGTARLRAQKSHMVHEERSDLDGENVHFPTVALE